MEDDTIYIVGSGPEKSVEAVDHPEHYNQYPIEAIDMMEMIFGKQAVYNFCLLNAFKYRMRAGNKSSLLEDIKKEKWYLEKAKSYLD